MTRTPYERLMDPRGTCILQDIFGGGLGVRKAYGYRYEMRDPDQPVRDGFDLGDFLRSTLTGGLMGGLSGVAFYGMDKAVKALEGSGTEAFDAEINKALYKLENSGLRPGQTEISKGKVQYIVDNYDPVKAQSSIYTDSTGRYLVEGHHTTVANMILDRGSGLNMNQVSPLSPSVKNVYWTKKWYEFWKKAIEIKK